MCAIIIAHFSTSDDNLCQPPAVFYNGLTRSLLVSTLSGVCLTGPSSCCQTTQVVLLCKLSIVPVNCFFPKNAANKSPYVFAQLLSGLLDRRGYICQPSSQVRVWAGLCGPGAMRIAQYHATVLSKLRRDWERLSIASTLAESDQKN